MGEPGQRVTKEVRDKEKKTCKGPENVMAYDPKGLIRLCICSENNRVECFEVGVEL